MTDVTPAFAYLIVRTTRNQLLRQVARLRNPRYALALLAGIAYFALMFGPSSTTMRESPLPHMVNAISTMGGILITLLVCGWWLLGGASTSLAFKPAEIQMLFPAPVSRRALLGYKVARSQLVIVLNALLWTLLLRRFGASIPAPLRFASAWGLLSVLSLHRLGLGLLQVAPVRGARWLALGGGKVLAGTVVLAILVGIGPAVLQIRTLGMADGLRGVAAALGTPPAASALAPTRALLAPLRETTPVAWAGAFAIVLGFVIAHLGWVFAMNVAFEDVAGAASVKLATRLAVARSWRGGAAVVGPVKKTRDWLPLAPLGHPAVAIAWKNTIALTRTGLMRSLITTVVLMIVMQRVLSSGDGDRPPELLAITSGIFVMTMVVMGPRFMRNDLRQDLVNLASIKSFPLSGPAIVAAEMAAPTLMLTGLEVALIGIGYYSLPAGANPGLGGAQATGLILLMPIALLALNAINIGIQNGGAVLFPGWIRIGMDSGGIEAMGQGMLMTIGAFFALLLALILPVGLGVSAFVGAKLAFDVSAIEVAVAVATAVLAGEIWVLVRAVGAAFERMEPGAAN